VKNFHIPKIRQTHHQIHTQRDIVMLLLDIEKFYFLVEENIMQNNPSFL